MVMSCMVLFCNNRGKIPGLSYYHLNTKRYFPWLRALGRDPLIEKLSNSNVICGEHFADKDFFKRNHTKILKPYAVPTLKLGPRKPAASAILSSIAQEIPSTSSDAYYVQKSAQICLEALKTYAENHTDLLEVEIRQDSLTSKRYFPCLRAIGRDPSRDPLTEKLSDSNLICNDHFADINFTNVNGIKFPKPHVVPSPKLGARQPPFTIINTVSSAAAEIPSTSSDNPSYGQKASEVCLEFDNEHQIDLLEVEIAQNSDSSSSTPSITPTNEDALEASMEDIMKNVAILKGKLKNIIGVSKKFNRPAKKIRRDVKLVHNYSLPPRMLLRSLNEVKKSIKKCHTKLRVVKGHVKKLKGKITNLKDIVLALETYQGDVR